MSKTLCNLLIELGILSLILFPPLVFGAVEPHYITIIQIIILALWGCWVLKTFLRKRVTYVPGPLDLPLLIGLALGVVNFAMSSYRHRTEQEFFLLLNYAIFYFVLLQQLKTVRRIVGLAFLLVLIGSGEALFGLVQYLRGATTVLGVATPNIGTVNATYINHNHFAGFLLLILPLALGLFVGVAHLEKRFFLLLVMLLMGTAFILTLSRGGIFSFLLALAGFIGCLLLKANERGQRVGYGRVVGILALIVIVVIVIGVGISWIGISPIAHRSLLRTFLPTAEVFRQEVRFPLWRNALRLVPEFPIFGSGLGTFDMVFLRHQPAEMPSELYANHAHNDYLELLIEMGIPGLLLSFWGIFRFIRTILSGYLQHRDPMLTALLLGGLTGCLGMFSNSFFDFNLHIPANALLFVAILALTTATLQLMDSGRRASQPRQHYALSWQFLASIIGITLLLGISSHKYIALIYFRQARNAQYERQEFLPITLFQKAVAWDPFNPLFHEGLGAFYNELGRNRPHGAKWLNLSLAEYRRAIALNRYNPAYYYYLGGSYAALQMERDAVHAFQTAIAHYPRFPFYYEQLAQYFFSIGQTEAALRRYRQVLEMVPRKIPELLYVCSKEFHLTYPEYRQIVPDDPESRKIFAVWLSEQKNWEASKTEYHNAIELSGKQAVYYAAMLDACQRRKDVACLQMLWRELAEQHPDNPEYAINIAESFRQQQRWDEARTAYQTLADRYPENLEFVTRLAQIAQQQGHLEEAAGYYQHMVRQQPAEAQRYHDLAGLYRQQADWLAVIATYQEALAQGVTQPSIYAGIGEACEERNDLPKALAYYEQAIQAGETRIAIYQRVEKLSQSQKRTNDLSGLWEKYLFANQHTLEATFQLARHYQAHGQWLQAVTLSKELIASAPRSVEYRLFLANLYEQQGMVFETIEQWEKVVAIQANNIGYHLRLAGLYEQNEAWDKARSQYRTILRLQPNHSQAQQRLSSLGG